MLEIISFVMGQVDTNTYLIADTTTAEAAVIDPAWDGEEIAQAASKRGWHIRQIWLTHAHFDHIAGITGLNTHIQPAPSIALHPADLPLYESRGAAELFGIHIGPLPQPTLLLSEVEELMLGNIKFEIRHTPGHSPGHVVYYCPLEGVMFCGDLIFAGSIGRDDLPGGDFQTLMKSIRTQVLSLPGSTKLLSGHGPETTVEDERRFNPFLTDMMYR
jgi:hydroxyacylglutathione hydrolase